MLRRLAIVAGTIVVLFAGVFAYIHVAGEEGRDTSSDGPPEGSTQGNPIPTGRLGSGRFNIQRCDKDGRLTGVYRADGSTRNSENSFALKRPTITLFRTTGQRIFIYADTGVLYADEIGEKFEPRRGILKGRVRVVIDRSTDPTRPAQQTPESELVRIFGQQVEFDGDDLAIHMRGEVAVLSAEADIFGTDLSILWNEAPKTDLKLFKIAHGRSMIVHGAENILSAPSSRGAATRPAARLPSPIGGLAGLVRTAAGADKKPDRSKPHNIYLATFNNNVHVFSAGRSLRYARTLTLTFEWDRDVQGLPGQDLKPRDSSAAAPAAAPMIAMTASGASPAAPPATAPADARPAEAKRPARSTVILWSGPLIVTPIGRTETPSAKRYFVKATGQRLVWETEDLAAVCQSFSLRQQIVGKKTVQAIRLTGGAGAPIRLARTAEGGGERVRCSEITFLPDHGRAELVGPGRIIDPPADEDVDDPLLALQLDRLGDPPGCDRVTWSKALVATLEDVETPGRTPERSARKAITGAVLTGNVELVQAGRGDFVRCDEMLQIWMKPGKRGANGALRYPSRAKATGNVRARQEGRDITADEMVVDFAERGQDGRAASPKPSAPDRKRPGNLTGGKEMAARAVRLQADGHVKIVDTRGTKPLTASADRLVSNLVDEKALLEGAPASITQGDASIHGPKIHLDQAAQSLVVAGAGQLKFNTDRDFDGKPIKTPRPMTATWNKQMAFTGRKDTATFVGGVTVISGQDKVSAREMDVTFEKTAAAGKAAPRGEAGKSAGQRAAGMTELGLDKRRLKAIACRGDVSMTRVRNNPGGRLVQRTRLTGDQLAYDAGGARMTVTGLGTLFMGDYRPPKPGADAKDRGWGRDKPSQTYFVWKRGMEFSRKDRQVVLHGGVKMEHRTADQIAKAKRLNIPALGPLPPGRNATMTCQKMIASFGQTAPAAADAVTLGQLRRFRAIGKVHLVEGRGAAQRRLAGQLLTYDRLKEIVVVEGTKDTPATLMYQPSPRATLKTFRSPRIECFLEDNKIVRVKIDEITGGG